MNSFMRIQSVAIKNFRSLCDETIHLNDYTCLVGPNGSGKSSVLTALRIFFRDTMSSTGDVLQLGVEDFYNKVTSQEISITVTFVDLEQEAQKELGHYYRQGKLIVSAVAEWDPGTLSAPVIQYGERLVMKEFAKFFEAVEQGLLVGDLREVYKSIRAEFSDLPQVQGKNDMLGALRAYEEANPNKCISIRSKAQFYGFTKGENLLSKYIQWICVPAVKDATTEQLEAKKNALAQLLERTVRTKISFKDPLEQLTKEMREKYGRILEENQTALDGLSDSLETRLRQFSHPAVSLRISWDPNSAKYVSIAEPAACVVAGERSFKGGLEKFGHGFQRSFLLALLQELSESGSVAGPRLILACEEPELYQHPPQARHLSSVLQELGKKNSQVIVTTHSPYFVSGWGFEDTRIFKVSSPPAKTIRSVTFEDLAYELSDAFQEKIEKPADIAIRLEQALQPELNEIFFCSTIVLVEGLEDFAFLNSYFLLSSREEEYRRYGCHIVPVGGKSELPRPIAIAKRLGIPCFVVLDADGDESDTAKRANHKRLNEAILRLCGVSNPEPFPDRIFTADNVVMWDTKIEKVFRSEVGEDEWNRAAEEVRRQQCISTRGVGKNSLFIGLCLAHLWGKNKKSSSLIDVCDRILRLGYESQGQQGEPA